MTDATAGKIPHVLVIMDGVGHREAIEDNAFLQQNTKFGGNESQASE